MKKSIKKLLGIISLVLLTWPSISSAQLTNLKGATPELLQGGSIYSIIGTIIQTLLGFVGVLFIVLVIYGGFTWMTAGGDSGKVQKAKDTIIKATIGIVIIMASYAIVYTIINQITLES
ncbi:hypothetical protein GW933_03815 [Candidatus Falkowbacteria bacterium]|uniref:Uncharacterized protein n=1 Tax=Candidatus Buchananbacteria bacterium CG10_big_fil_rev_8_21_14_0_10_33_19 TaxID=1974525 RepID=A0A2H0W596_9BACT|nr:hypothetical protein [Candidatus Falkowbacteria bacterium]PIS06526.1 MAG: hypothetical protein COT80_00180 [Candidatus Buchananbacteria bacterium CG10_big_fil_rev_8_21_14_0_10_33_19]